MCYLKIWIKNFYAITDIFGTDFFHYYEGHSFLEHFVCLSKLFEP